MAEPVCPNCGTVLLPGNRVCPFCRMPIQTPRRPPIAPSPPEAPLPPRLCPNCRVELAMPRRVPIPQPAGSPMIWDAYACPRCGRLELYEARDPER